MKIETIRHSLAHIMALAIKEFYPEAKFGIGPAIENGFYYDFDVSAGALMEADLPKIEKKMRELIKQNIPFKKRKLTRNVLVKLFKGQPYKLELLGLAKQPTIYESGKFVDLCKGPHIKSTKEIPIDSFKLIKVAGA